jgi:hypothetical protein
MVSMGDDLNEALMAELFGAYVQPALPGGLLNMGVLSLCVGWVGDPDVGEHRAPTRPVPYEHP